MIEVWPLCKCGDEINPKRHALGYRTCLSCGSPAPQRTVVPVHKSNYVLCTNPAELRGLGKTPNDYKFEVVT